MLNPATNLQKLRIKYFKLFLFELFTYYLLLSHYYCKSYQLKYHSHLQQLICEVDKIIQVLFTKINSYSINKNNEHPIFRSLINK